MMRLHETLTHPTVSRDWLSMVGCWWRFCSRIRAPPVRKAMPGTRSKRRMTTPTTDAWRIRRLDDQSAGNGQACDFCHILAVDK
jgi:hypothetical protein